MKCVCLALLRTTGAALAADLPFALYQAEHLPTADLTARPRTASPPWKSATCALSRQTNSASPAISSSSPLPSKSRSAIGQRRRNHHDGFRGYLLKGAAGLVELVASPDQAEIVVYSRAAAAPDAVHAHRGKTLLVSSGWARPPSHGARNSSFKCRRRSGHSVQLGSSGPDVVRGIQPQKPSFFRVSTAYSRMSQ